MTATKPLGTYGNAAGTVTPLDHKMAQTGMVLKTTTVNVPRAGIFYNGTASLITAKANMSYDVAAFTVALTRGATSGTVLLSNDGTLNVTTTAAPGSNSRIDIIYVWAREYTLDGTDSNPVIAVTQGTAAAVPVAPSLAAFPGAIEIGRATVGAGITATTSATLTQTAPFTCMDGGRFFSRTKTELDAITNLNIGAESICADTLTYRWNGTAWMVSMGPIYWTGTNTATTSLTTATVAQPTLLASKNFPAIATGVLTPGFAGVYAISAVQQWNVGAAGTTVLTDIRISGTVRAVSQSVTATARGVSTTVSIAAIVLTASDTISFFNSAGASAVALIGSAGSFYSVTYLGPA